MSENRCFRTYAEGFTINEVTFNAYSRLIRNGSKIPSRNGDCTALYDFTYYLHNPRARHLNLKGRSSNIFQLIGETLWVLSGSNNVKGYLETMLPRAPQYSDDGETWRAGYGKRLFTGNQLPDVVKYFEKDGKMTRRAAISIFDPNLDTFTQLKEVYGQEDTKDFSCNNLIYFSVDPDDRFNMRVTNRSNDAVFGMGINLTEFSVIQELVYEQVVKLYPEVTLGSLSVYSNNFHSYDFTFSQVDEVVKEYGHAPHLFGFCDKYKPLGAPSIESTRLMMENFTKDVLSFPDPEMLFDDYLMEYSLDPMGQLADYMELMAYYFAAKNGHVKVLDISNYQSDLQEAIINSKFRKFPVKVTQVYE